METHLRSDIEQPITVTNDSNEVEEVASVKFGVKKISIYFTVKLDNYELDLKGREDAIVFKIRDQQVSGQLILHVEKAANLIVNLGDIINKDYVIDFAVLIKELTVAVTAVPTHDGIPQLAVGLCLSSFDLSKDMKYNIHNEDVLTKIIDLTQSGWMPLVQRQIDRDLLDKLVLNITTIINKKLKSLYITEFALPTKDNLAINSRF